MDRLVPPSKNECRRYVAVFPDSQASLCKHKARSWQTLNLTGKAYYITKEYKP